MIRARLPLLLAVLAGACSPPAPPPGPIEVSLIGSDATLAEPARRPPDGAQGTLLAAVAQGLVRRDARGEIEPGLASRWDVSDDGLAYTFRIAEGSPLDAEAVARLLRAAIGPRSALPERLLFDGVDEIVAVTPEVIEIRLTTPRPDLLDLLAMPGLALLADGHGGGPLSIADPKARPLLLTPRPLAADDNDDDAPDARPPAVRVRVERAALAIVRFAAGGTGYVGGGTFADLPIVSAADADVASLRFDPVDGLFGLRVLTTRGALADAAGRRRLSRAIDRARIVAAIGAPNLQPATPPAEPAVAPGQTPATSPLAPSVAPVSLRMAVPVGPGAAQLFRLIAADWAAIGVPVDQVAWNDPDADLRLIDAVAPTAAADWPIARLECRDREPCVEGLGGALAAARAAVDPPTRAAAIAAARRLLDDSGLYIAISRPVRWSLVSARVPAWHENERAAHPLDQLRR